MAHNIKIYVINVAKNKARRDHILSQADMIGNDVNFFNAVTPQTMGNVKHRYNEDKARRFTGRPMMDTEIACSLSHMELWRQLLGDEEVSHYLIMEDDVTIHHPLCDVLKHIDLGQYSLLRLSGQVKRPTRKVKDITDGHALYRYAYGPLDAAAYIVDKAGARKLLAYCETLHSPIDILMDRSYDHKVPIYGIMPYMVSTKWCLDKKDPLYTDIGIRDHKYAPDVTLAERICVKGQRVWGGFMRKMATVNMYIER